MYNIEVSDIINCLYLILRVSNKWRHYLLRWNTIQLSFTRFTESTFPSSEAQQMVTTALNVHLFSKETCMNNLWTSVCSFKKNRLCCNGVLTLHSLGNKETLMTNSSQPNAKILANKITLTTATHTLLQLLSLLQTELLQRNLMYC